MSRLIDKQKRDLVAELQEIPDEVLDANAEEVNYFVGLSEEERKNALKENADGDDD